MKRPSGRASTQLRSVRITRNYTKHAEGSVLVEFGDTKVICTASVEAGVPMGWREFVGDAGRIVGLTHYGASAAYSVLYEKFGLTDEAVLSAARESIAAAASGNAVPAGPVAATGGLPHPTGDR